MNNIAQLKEIPHWSYSVFQTFLTCPLKYQFRYIDSMLFQGANMLEAVCQNWTDDFSVKSVAESFSVTVPGLSKPLIGEFDCIVEDGKDICIVDWKTSASRWPSGKADNDLQATVFTYAYKAKYDIKPLFRFDVVTKAKTYKIILNDWKNRGLK